MSAAVAVFGSRFRGDDAVGPLVGDRLRALGIEVLDCRDEPTRLLDRLGGLDLVVVVDAVCSGAAPGAIHRVAAVDGSLPRNVQLASTHALAVTDALELASVLGRAPRRVEVVGIEGEAFGLGDPVTPAVAAAVDEVVESVVALIEAA